MQPPRLTVAHTLEGPLIYNVERNSSVFSTSPLADGWVTLCYVMATASSGMLEKTSERDPSLGACLWLLPTVFPTLCGYFYL